MASNFKMMIAGKGKNLRIRLVGDLDGTSAHQVIGAVQKHGKRACAISIDTTDLRTIYPFGLDILQKDLAGLNNSQAVTLMFTGSHAAELAPKGMWATL